MGYNKKNMQIKFFTLPINQIDSYNYELNVFLRNNKIIEITKELVQVSNNAFWCIAVSFVEKNNETQRKSVSERIDYREVLEPKVFQIFSDLREVRKEIANEEKVSVFVIFGNAELAEIAKMPEITTAKLQKIKGIGKGKIEKYGNLLVSKFTKLMNEKSGKPDAANTLFG